MTRIVDDASHSPARKRRDLEDRKRMEYRRAIEDFSERRRLNYEIHDYPELAVANAMVGLVLHRHG
ncbi:MAG: transcriptional regulator [Pseudomonas sp.]|uniref:PA3496 family putative envelope integrity protein n=1 Tax=Pseudomonas sp. TaxID=306 RepID=UPI0027329582|nr:transcriptional regulator [Pseudomonas sp.]MDP3847696.1 transcriptional regulator [Pseudomonas sp.]